MFQLDIDFVLGTVQLGLPYGKNRNGPGCSVADAEAILEAAWNTGVRSFDTATSYGNAAEILKNWLLRTDRLSDSLICNKIPQKDCFNEGKIEEACEGFIDSRELVLLSHGFLSREEWDIFAELTSKKGIRAGQSVYTAEEVHSISGFRPHLIQAPANVLDFRQLDASRSCSQRMDFRSIYLQGLLLEPPSVADKRVVGSGAYISNILKGAELVGLEPSVALIGSMLHKKKPGDRLVIGVDKPSEISVWHSAVQTSRDQIMGFLGTINDQIRSTVPLRILDPRTWPKI